MRNNRGEPIDRCAESERIGWARADFATLERDVWPTVLIEHRCWMVRRTGEKRPFAPWGKRNHPDADPEKDARFSWSISDHWADKETADKWVEMDPGLEGYAVILDSERDPYSDDPDPAALVDGDNVRCPETGEVHPVFIELLDSFGVTYADVSRSNSGVHALYEGRLPDDVKRAAFEIDDEPWGANDEPPSVEIYDGKRVCVVTGAHVPGTPKDVRPWDNNALTAILDEYVPENDRHTPTSHDTDTENPLDDYEPIVTGPRESTGEIRDVFYAVENLRPGDLPLRTVQVGEESGADGWEKWDPSSYRTSSGGDSLHRPPHENVFYDQKTGHTFGLLGLFAAEQGLISKPWHDLSGATWWEAVERAREAGASIPEYENPDGADSEPVAVLPHSPRALHAANGWDWQSADRADTLLTIDSARDRTTEAIADVYEAGGPWLVEALPTMGKSYGAIKAAAETGAPITVLAGRGNKEQYDQYKKWCAEHGLRAKVLPSVHRDCETFQGEHGEGIEETVKDWYRRGATGKDIHRDAEYELGEPLPCDGPAGRRCSYKIGWEFDPEEYDILIGNYLHAHVGSATQGRTVVVDEFPGDAFETTLANGLAGAVTQFVQCHDAIPYDDHTDLIENRSDPRRRADALTWFTEHAPKRDGTLAFASSKGHAAAPLATFTILAAAANNLGNGWERATLPGMNGGVGLYDRENECVHLLTPPDLQYARGVVGLDGTPTPTLWKIAMGTRLNHRQVLTDDERAEYVRDTLGLNIIRTTDAVKPYSGTADHVAIQQDRALLEAIADKHGQKPSLLTTQTAELAYGEEGVLDIVRDVDHYGNLKGSNERANTRLGAVIGSRNFGDQFVKQWGAFAGEAVADPDRFQAETRGVNLSYGAGVGDDVLRHMREHETLQAIMRFGRDGQGATVYVHTNTLPDWIEDGGVLAGQGRVIQTWSDGMRQVLDAARSVDEWTTAEIADHPAVEIGEWQVRKHLHNLAKRGYVNCEVEGNGFVWRDDGLHRVGEHGEVELTPVQLDELSEEETAVVSRSSNYTWDHASSPSSPEGPAGGSDRDDQTEREAVADGGDRPPSDAG